MQKVYSHTHTCNGIFQDKKISEELNVTVSFIISNYTLVKLPIILVYFLRFYIFKLSLSFNYLNLTQLIITYIAHDECLDYLKMMSSLIVVLSLSFLYYQM